VLIGHLGVGLALSSRSRRFRLGPLLGAALLLDILLWLFVLAGLEQVIVPPDFPTGHFLEFVFPYSHGLFSSLVWSGLTAVLAARGWLLLGSGAAAAWVASVAVLSHFLCDAVEHVQGLPLLGESSPHVGLGLWRAMPWALVLELVLLVCGAVLFLRSRPGLPRLRRGVLLAVLGLLATFQLFGQLAGATLPPLPVLATVSIVQTAVLVLLGLWADRETVSAPAALAPGD